MRLLYFRKRQPRFRHLFIILHPQQYLRSTAGRSVQETFVHMAYLLHIQTAEGKLHGFCHACCGLVAQKQHGLQHVQYHLVVHGKGTGLLIPPRRAVGATFKKGIRIRVEQRTSIGRHAQAVMRNSAIDRPEQRKQPYPGIVPRSEQLLPKAVGHLPQRFIKCRSRVGAVVKFIAQTHQTALFRRQQKDQTHHDRKRRIVQTLRLHIPQKPAVILTVELVKRMQKFRNGAADLQSQLIGNFLLLVRALLYHARQRFLFRQGEKTAFMQQSDKGLQRDALFQPQTDVPGDVGRGSVLSGIHQHELLFSAHQAERHAAAPAQLGHAPCRTP